MAEEKLDQQIEPLKAEQNQEPVAITPVKNTRKTALAKPDVKQKSAKKSANKVAQKSKSETPRIKAKRENFGDLLFYSDVRSDLPPLRPGDLVKVAYRVIEGGKERTQLFEGTIIALKNRGVAKTVTVRKNSFGVAVERILPLNSKLLQSIEVLRHSKVRRAKLYYLRKLSGKAARLKELR